MTKTVNLYLASCVSDGRGFWLVNFTEDDDIYNSLGTKFLECYRKELFGLSGAIEVKNAINSTLDILSCNLKFESFELDKSNTGYSFEIPINITEGIFDLWALNYTNEIIWKKYLGLLNFKKKIKRKNNYINKGLKGDTYKFYLKLDKLLSFKANNCIFKVDRNNELMW
tara:strand:+ start:289 stop:795 length:507 start_codon:yes stop_codon:yes gene_type:complete